VAVDADCSTHDALVLITVAKQCEAHPAPCLTTANERHCERVLARYSISSPARQQRLRMQWHLHSFLTKLSLARPKKHYASQATEAACEFQQVGI
jgi:hypothetical protein